MKVEHTTIRESTAKFTEGIQNNTFLAKLHPLAVAFSTTCDNCCKWVGHQQYYSMLIYVSPIQLMRVLTSTLGCTGCIEEKFILCGECYRSGTAFCYDRLHHASMRMMVSNDGPAQCRHMNFPTPPEAHFPCYRCAKNLEGVFVRK